MGIQNLSKETIRVISSGQVITSIGAVIKELVENSIDANSTNIECKLVGGGFSTIIVKDNGMGIPLKDRKYMGNRYCTSKLPDGSFENISKVTTYGFRGEALNSIASISQGLSIETRTQDDIIGKLYKIDKMGNVISETPTNASLGTTIQITKIFHNTPVRKQAALKQQNSMKNILEMLTSYALVHPNIRFSFKNAGSASGKLNNNNVEWHSIASNSTMDSIKNLFGSDLSSQLQEKCSSYSFNEEIESDSDTENVIKDDGDENEEEKSNDPLNEIKLRAILPKPDIDQEKYFRSSTDRIFFYVNKRPIQLSLMPIFKEILKIIKEKLSLSTGGKGFNSSNKRYPFVYLEVNVPSFSIDVNLEPSKTKVFFHYPKKIKDCVEKLTDEIYHIQYNPSITPPIFNSLAINYLNEVNSKKYIQNLQIQDNKAAFSKGFQLNDIHDDNDSKDGLKIKKEDSILKPLANTDPKDTGGGFIKESYLKKSQVHKNESISSLFNYIKKASPNLNPSSSSSSSLNSSMNSNKLKRLLDVQNEFGSITKRLKPFKQNSTLNYSVEISIDIPNCRRNYKKFIKRENDPPQQQQQQQQHTLIQKNKVKVVGFINNKDIVLEDKLDSKDDTDHLWIIKDNNQLVLGSWKRLNSLVLYQKLLKTKTIPSKVQIPPLLYELSPEDKEMAKLFIFETSNNNSKLQKKKILNSFICLNGFEVWLADDHQTIEINKVPNIPDIFGFFDNLKSFKELLKINQSIHNIQDIIKVDFIEIYQRPPNLCKYLKSYLPKWTLPNVPLTEISANFLCPKLQDENLLSALQFLFANQTNQTNINPSQKYEGFLSPHDLKPIAKPIFNF